MWRMERMELPPDPRWQLAVGAFNRWYIRLARHPNLAWAGSAWAAHQRGAAAARVQICNFDSAGEAAAYAVEHRAEIEAGL